MALTNEDLLAFSQLLDVKLDSKIKPIESRLQRMETDIQCIQSNLTENIGPRLESVEKSLTENISPRLTTVEHKLRRIEVDLLENNVVPRLNTIEACYMDTYNRYRNYTDKMEAAFADTELLKKVVSEHSEKIQKLA